MRYVDRRDAGRRLAQVLRWYKSDDVVVLALPRGGVVLGAEVARALDVPLGLLFVRKIGHPSYEEFAIGAIAEGEQPIYNNDETARLSKSWLRLAETATREQIRRRREAYYGAASVRPRLRDKVVMIIDDGIATGLTMEAAVRAVRGKHPKSIIVAAPVASRSSVNTLQKIADKVIILDDPDDFLGAVGAHYEEFEQLDDEEVIALLQEAQHEIHQAVA